MASNSPPHRAQALTLQMLTFNQTRSSGMLDKDWIVYGGLEMSIYVTSHWYWLLSQVKEKGPDESVLESAKWEHFKKVFFQNMFLVILPSFWDFSFGDPKCRFQDVTFL